jgi:WD40 repeat protein
MKPPKERGKPILPPCQVTRIRFSPDGTELAVACVDGVVRRWSVADAKPLTDLKGHDGWVTTVSYLPNGDLLSADSWGKLVCWSNEKVRWSIAAHDGWLRAVAIAKDLIATCSRDGFVRLWNPKDGAKIREAKIGVDLHSLAFSPNGSLVVGDLFGRIRVFDSTLKTLREFEQKEFHLLDRIQDVGGVRCLTFSPDGKTLYAAGCQPKTGGFVQAFPLLVALDFATGKTLGSWKGSNDSEGIVHDLRVLADGRLAAVTSGQPGQGKFLLFEPPIGTPAFVSTKQPNCHSVDLAPDGKRIATSATNANSSGNGRVKGKAGEYPENQSPIQFWDAE